MLPHRGSLGTATLAVFLNFTLLPIDTLEVLVDNDDFPVVSWSSRYRPTCRWRRSSSSRSIASTTAAETTRSRSTVSRSAGACWRRICRSPRPTRRTRWPRARRSPGLGGANDGTPGGGLGFTAGRVGQAFDFDGADDFVSVPHDPSLDVGGDFSLDFWVRTSDGSGMPARVWV